MSDGEPKYFERVPTNLLRAGMKEPDEAKIREHHEHLYDVQIYKDQMKAKISEFKRRIIGLVPKEINETYPGFAGELEVKVDEIVQSILSTIDKSEFDLTTNVALKSSSEDGVEQEFDVETCISDSSVFLSEIESELNSLQEITRYTSEVGDFYNNSRHFYDEKVKINAEHDEDVLEVLGHYNNAMKIIGGDQCNAPEELSKKIAGANGQIVEYLQLPIDKSLLPASRRAVYSDRHKLEDITSHFKDFGLRLGKYRKDISKVERSIKEMEEVGNKYVAQLSNEENAELIPNVDSNATPVDLQKELTDTIQTGQSETMSLTSVDAINANRELKVNEIMKDERARELVIKEELAAIKRRSRIKYTIIAGIAAVLIAGGGAYYLHSESKEEDRIAEIAKKWEEEKKAEAEKRAKKAEEKNALDDIKDKVNVFMTENSDELNLSPDQEKELSEILSNIGNIADLNKVFGDLPRRAKCSIKRFREDSIVDEKNDTVSIAHNELYVDLMERIYGKNVRTFFQLKGEGINMSIGEGGLFPAIDVLKSELYTVTESGEEDDSVEHARRRIYISSECNNEMADPEVMKKGEEQRRLQRLLYTPDGKTDLRKINILNILSKKEGLDIRDDDVIALRDAQTNEAVIDAMVNITGMDISEVKKHEGYFSIVYPHELETAITMNLYGDMMTKMGLVNDAFSMPGITPDTDPMFLMPSVTMPKDALCSKSSSVSLVVSRPNRNQPGFATNPGIPTSPINQGLPRMNNVLNPNKPAQKKWQTTRHKLNMGRIRKSLCK